MTIILAILFLLLGLAVGSFLNVVIFRMNTGKSFGGRSACMTCHKVLSWHELVPVFSFLWQRGRCRGCWVKISRQYPWVEFLSGLVFVGLFLRLENLFYYGSSWSFSITYAYFAVMFALFIVIAAYDMRHKIIPDVPVIILGALALVGMFLFSGGILHPHLPSWMEILTGILFALPFAAIWLLSRGAWMGLGDAKLTLGMAWFLGPSTMLSSLALAFWTGAALGLIMMAMKKLHGLKSEIPFAPFLLLGALIAFFFQLNFFPAGA